MNSAGALKCDPYLKHNSEISNKTKRLKYHACRRMLPAELLMKTVKILWSRRVSVEISYILLKKKQKLSLETNI